MTNSNSGALLAEFADQVGPNLIATGIVTDSGKLECYIVKNQDGKKYDVERSASIFAMIVNIFNVTLAEIYEKKEEVDEVLVTTESNYFLVRIIQPRNLWHGITFKKDTDIHLIRQLMKHYKFLFLSTSSQI